MKRLLTITAIIILIQGTALYGTGRDTDSMLPDNVNYFIKTGSISNILKSVNFASTLLDKNSKESFYRQRVYKFCSL